MNKKYNSARNVILVVTAITVLNIALVAFGSDTMFLFSASIPYYCLWMTLEFGYILEAVIALVAIFVLLASWLLSKDRILGLVLAIGYFVIDALYLLWLVDFEIGFITGELIFHAIIIAYLAYALFLFPKGKSAEDELLSENTETK